MGNIVLVKKVLSGGICPSTKKFNLEDLIKMEIVSAVYNKFASETGQYHGDYKLEDIFEDFEKQENNNDDDNWKRNLVKELNELHTAGLSTPDYFTQDLKETRFEKYFRVVIRRIAEGEEYYKTQYSKFFLLYSYIRPYYSEECKKKDEFYKNLAEKLEDSDDGGVSLHSFEMGVTLTFSLLDDLANLSPSILENALKNIYSVLIQLKSGLLKTSDYKFYEREQIFNRHRDYLVELVKSDKISDAIKQYAVKILIVIGNLRESGEDYLIAFNLIRQNNLKVNIDAELSQNIYFQEIGSSNTEEIARKFKLLENESTEVEFMTGIGNDPNVNSHTNFTFDDKYVYLWNYNTGLFKIGMKSTISTKRGLIYSFSSTESAYLFKQVLFLKNKLYVRNYIDLNTPFKIYDRNTLEVIEPDDYKNNLIKCQRNNNSDAWNTQILEVTNSSYLEEAIRRGEAEKFRTLVETPLFTDGKHIYVISTYVIEGAYEKEEVGYEVEAYCPDTWKCIKSFKLILEPEQDQNISNEASMKIVEETEMIKNCLLQSSILKSYCATNGQTMTFTQNGKMFFFDLETGLRYPETIEVPKTDGGYNYLTNTFWHYNSSAKNPTLKSFKIDGFKNVIEDSSETVLNLSEAIKSHTKLVVEQQKSKTKPQQRNLEGFLKKLGSRSKPKFSESEIKTNESVSLSLYLCMYIVGRGCEELDKIMQKWAGDIMDKETKLNLQSSMFRSKFCVSISSTFISELLDSLEYFNQFVDEEMNDENILEQYQFMWIIKLAHRFITSLEKLNLTLDEIANDETEDSGSIIADKFKEILSSVVSKITNPGLKSSQFQTEKYKKESQSIWKETLLECRGIQNLLLNLTSESGQTLTNKISQLAESIKENTVTASQEIFLKYLSQSDSLTNILEENSQDIIFEALCDRKVEKLVSHLDSLNLNSSYKELEYSELELISEEFIYSFTNRTLISVFKVQSSISNAIDNDQKKKLEVLREQADSNMKYFTKVLNKLASSAQKIFEATTRATRRVLDEAIPAHNEETKDKEKQTFNTKAKYLEFQNHLNEIVGMHNKFIEFIHIYVASLTSDRGHRMTKHLNNMCRKTIDLLYQISKFCHVDTEATNSTLEISDSECILRTNLSEDFMKFLIWSLSKIAHSFIKIKESDKQKDDESTTSQNLLKSKLLSGGIQNRFLSCLSKETCETIENLAEMTGDKKMMQYLSKIELLPEDELMLGFIHPGTNPSIDSFMEILQWNLLKKNPGVKAGGKEGMEVSRCAFASILSLNRHEEACSYANLQTIIDQIEISLESCDESMNENQKNKQIMEDLKELGDMTPIIERWESASKMRMWLQEKRKDISNYIKKKVEAEFQKKREEEQQLEEIKEKSAHEIEIDTKEDNDEETIDTSSKTTKNKDNQEIQNEIMRREEEQMASLIKKVSEKAELLIKLSVPSSWELPDNSNNIYEMQEDVEVGLKENIVVELQKIKSIQSAAKTISSFENLSNKAIFNSCASSVLACLQCSINYKKIMSSIERKCINAMNRYCGLKIMGSISTLFMTDDTKISCFNWFCSALRKNTNVLAHYSDELMGVGDHLLDQCRIAFFEIYSGIVKQIKETTNKETIEFLLNCVKWKISATDHQYILKSGIIQTLKEGNGQQNREKNPIKYSWGHKLDYKSYDGDISLSRMVNDSLEFIMMACFARILGEDEDHNLIMGKTGTSIDKIQIAYSVVNTNITELLLGSCFEIVFEQIARYAKIIDSFDPIDWKLFVQKRNKLRFTNQSLKIDDSLPFDDEKTIEEKQKEVEDELKEEEKNAKEQSENGGNKKDQIAEYLLKQTDKEINKMNSMYDDKVILKLLRLVELFTSIAIKSTNIHKFVLQVTRPPQIKSLVYLLLTCQSRHGMMTLKILRNLLQIGIEKSTLDSSFSELREIETVKEIFDMKTKVVFEDCPFIQFCYNYLLKIRSSQWDKRRIESYGAYTISCNIIRLLRTILKTNCQPVWKNKIEDSLDQFIDDIKSYSIEEFDVMMSLFEGGEYNGLNIGAYGKTSEGNKFITAGFVKDWYDLSTPDGQGAANNFGIKNISSDINTKDDYLLAIYYDEAHPQRNDMFLAIPDQVTTISSLTNQSDNYLLNKERLNKFLNAMDLDKVPDNNDIISLTKRCVGIKIIINQIEYHADEIAKLFDESFRDRFINFLLSECTKVNPTKDNIKYDWYDQKLYAIKKFATENQVELKHTFSDSISFNGKLMSISSTIGDVNEPYIECYPLVSALNYGALTQKMSYRIFNSSTIHTARYRNDNAVILKSSEIDSVNKILEVFKHAEVIITSDLDLKTINEQIKLSGSSKNIHYFRSIVIISHDDFESLIKLNNEGPKAKIPDTQNLSPHESLLVELETFCNFQRNTLDEIFKGKEESNLGEKIRILSNFSTKSKEENKKVEKKDEIQYNEVNKAISSLLSNENLRTNLAELSSYANNNYNSPPLNKAQKGELFSKAYNISSSGIIETYKNTLNGFYQQSCKKTLSSFFDHISLENLLEITLTSDENIEKFLKYIQLRGNDAVILYKQSNNRFAYDDFLKLLKKIIEICVRNKKFNKVIDILFNKVILLGTSNIIIKANKDKKKNIREMFATDESALNSLNIFLLPDTFKFLIQEYPTFIYENTEFKNLITLLLMITITFREEKDFHKRIYMTVYKLILPFVQKPKEFNNIEIIKGIMSHQFLKDLFDKIPKQSTNSNENFSNEHKLLFEIYLLVHLLEEAYPDVPTIYSYPDQILDIEKCKIILREMRKFDFVSYLIYLEKELTEEERKNPIVIETLHNRYKAKFTSTYQFNGFKKVNIKLHEDSKLEGMYGVAFSTDPIGDNIVKKISKTNLDKGENNFEFAGRTVYIHYPYNPSRVMCFGYGYNYRFGNNESYNTTSNPIEMPNFSVPLKKLCSRSQFTIGLGVDGKLYWTGYKSEWSGYKYYMSKYDYLMPEEKVVDLKVATNNCALLTEEGKIYVQGYDYNYHLDANTTKNYFWHKERPNEDEEKIIGFDLGYNYHVYVTDNGKAYGAGNDFMKGINLESKDKKYVQIPFADGVIPKMPVCTNNSECNKPLLMFVEVAGRSELWSAGYSSYGLLGQGDGVTSSKGFAPLIYDKENVVFTKAVIKYYFGMAVTDKGELYGWGQNGYKQLAMTDTKNYFSPVEIPFFKNYYVHDFDCGDYHALIYASPRNDMSKKQMFATGDIRGISDQSAKTAEGVLQIKQFDDCNYTFIECGENSFFIGFCGEIKASENVGIHEGYTCEITNETPIKGTLHFWKSKQDCNWHFVSEKGYKQMKDKNRELPAICYATKTPIKDIQDREWPEYDENEVLGDEENVSYPVYIAHNIHNENKVLPIPKTDEINIFKPEIHDVNPLIFYRIARPLKEESVLPSLTLSKYFEETDSHGIKIVCTPNYTYEKNKDIINLQKEKYFKIVSSIKKFDEKHDGELLESIESYITKKSIDFLNNPGTQIDATEVEFASKELKSMASKDVQPRINAFLSFNQNFLKVIPYVILDEEMIKEVTEGKSEVQSDTLSVLFMISKSLAFKSTKYSYIKKIADSLPTSYNEPDVQFNRRLIMHKKDKGKVDHRGEWTMFGCAMKKLKDTNYESLRKASSNYKAWRACFVGEGSADGGGPFRESLTNISREIQSMVLPLLIPTQNNKNDHGLYRDCWTINPSSNSPSHLEMYKFLGALIGMAFRSGHVIDIKLPPIFWKKFIGDPVNLDDLSGSDAYAVQAIRDLEKNKDQIPEDMFEDMMNLNFTTQLSNGETVPLCEGGLSRKVGYHDVNEYNEMVFKVRSEEGIKQIEKMREGFELIFPMSILGVLNWKDIEERVRGPNEISVAVLKSITQYSNCSADSEFVQRFWRVFSEFTNDERSMFLKFTWGRSRLPPQERLRDQSFTIYLMDSYRYPDHNKQFPLGHTCGFTFDLPRYTTDETCKTKILYAITACGEIDTDGYSLTQEPGTGYDSD